MSYQGKITLFNQPRGWGFISRDDGSEDTFFHVTNAVAGYTPKLGALVEFELAPPLKLGKKDQAINLREAKS